jgi:hypothetical protein
MHLLTVAPFGITSPNLFALWLAFFGFLQSSASTARESLVLYLSIALILLNAKSAWRPIAPKDKNEPKGTNAQHWLILIGAGVAIFAVLLTGTDWCARLFSPPPAVIVASRAQQATNMPNCNIEGFAVGTTKGATIKSLEMVLVFPHEIHDHLLSTLRDGPKTRTEVDAPCEINDTSSDRNNALTFAISSNRREVIIRGHDFTLADAQQFLMTFVVNNDDWINNQSSFDEIGDATYDANGREVAANIKMRLE